MDGDGWILKCPKLISNTEKQRLKIYSRGQTLKNTILKTTTKTQKNLRNTYEVCFKNRVFLFFCKVIVGYKNKNYRVIEDFKKKKKLFN